MPVSRDDPDRPDWARSLRGLRLDAGLSQPQVVHHLSTTLPDAALTQSTISRAERGGAVPSEAIVRALGALYRADTGLIERLVADTRDAAAGVNDVRLVVQRGSTLAMQQRWRRIEGQSREVRALQTGMVLGLLQTDRYAARAMQVPDDHPAIADRVRRHQTMLRDTSRRYLLVQTEGSLRVPIGSADLMAEQLDAMTDLIGLPNVDLRILGMAEPVDEPLTAGGFHIYDDTVVLGLELGAATLDATDDVAYFRGLFEQYHRAALSGDHAAERLREVAAEYRKMS